MLHIYTDGGLEPLPTLYPAGLGQGGCGVVILKDSTLLTELTRTVAAPVTSQQMELYAAITALEYIQADPTLRGEACQIYSDSAYLVNCIYKGWWYGWMFSANRAWTTSDNKPVKNIELWRRLFGLCRGIYQHAAERHGPQAWKHAKYPSDIIVLKKAAETGLHVSFNKVAGHSTDVYNNRADALATIGKRATEERQTLDYA